MGGRFKDKLNDSVDLLRRDNFEPGIAAIKPQQRQASGHSTSAF